MKRPEVAALFERLTSDSHLELVDLFVETVDRLSPAPAVEALSPGDGVLTMGCRTCERSLARVFPSEVAQRLTWIWLTGHPRPEHDPFWTFEMPKTQQRR